MGKVNNKTIENAKMVSFRIITEFLLSTFFLLLLASLLYANRIDKMRMFICPLPQRLAVSI